MRDLRHRRAQHGGGQRPVREQIARDALHVRVGHALDARERLIEPEMAIEVDLLPRQVRHAAGGVLQAQHQAALEMILGAPQLRDRGTGACFMPRSSSTHRSITSPTASFAQPA